MAKGAEKCSPCMLSRHVVHLGILKWTRMRGSSPSILKLDKSLSHLRNLRVNLSITTMQNLYKCTEGVVAKLSQRRQSKQLQTMIWFSVNLNTHVFMEAEILFPISKETAEWNCSVCKIDVHLYVSIVCDGCLEWNHLK
jgi:hypothetical protein